MNLNKLFPRLTIRAKLGVAFTLLAILPLALVAAATTRANVHRLRAAAVTTLDHDVQSARMQVERALGRAEQDVVFLTDALLREPAAGGSGTAPGETGRVVREFLDHSAFLFRVKVVGPDGVSRFEAGTTVRAEQSAADEAGGMYYAYRAQELGPSERLLLPVEVRGTGPDGKAQPVPAVAILVPIRDPRGHFAGVVVGEASAATLFGSLDQASPGLAGTTGLVDADGRFLYHSERKRDWRSLLAEGLDADFQALLSGGATDRPTRRGGYLVRAAPLALGSATGGPLTLVRAVPLAELEAPVREFLSWVVVTGAVVVILVVVLALAAARQLTRPIYQIRAAAHALARQQAPPTLKVETNDELEDLAGDFTAMAAELSRQRTRLEELVAERTEQLRRTDAELTDILAHSADAIVGLDAGGRIRVWNRGAEQLFGYPADDALGRDADELLAPVGSQRGAERAFLARELAHRGAVVDFQTERVARGGRRIPVSLTQTLLHDDAGRPIGASLILRDASLQARLEAHMRRSERLAAISVMAAGLAHEINNPLAIIGNRLECMEGEVGDLGHPSLQRDLAVVREHATRLGELTRNLLRFAHHHEDLRTPVAIDEVAHRVGGLLERMLAGRNVRLHLAATAVPRVYGSASALETVCLNLVLNAADAMPDGGTVTLATQGVPDAVELVVADEGEGIPPDLAEQIFEPFFTTKADRGTGLGLSVCRTIVRRHGGTIRVESVSPRGSRFIVRLPTASPVEEIPAQ